MIVKCLSCGASFNINTQQKCDFCGNEIEISSEEINNQTFNKTLLKADIVKGKGAYSKSSITYNDRGIKSIEQLIELYTDSEIDEIEEIILPNNQIRSAKNISKFTLWNVDLSNNLLEILDDFPKLKLKYSSTYFKSFYSSFSINLSNNKNLTKFDQIVIDKINNIKNIGLFYINLIGCKLFNYDQLELINFDKILDEDESKNIKHKATIYVDKNTPIPKKLIAIGFVIEDNIGQENINTWILSVNEHVKIQIGDKYSNSYLNKSKTDKVYAALIKSGENEAIKIAKSIFENNTHSASRMIQEIKKTEHYFPSSKKMCFIATATMGNYNHPVVIDLRMFRDNWLLKRDWGIKFTNWYYNNGPKAAKLIEKSYFLKNVSYVFIVKPLQLISKFLK